MPTQTFEHEATAAASPRVVWQALQEASTWEAIPGVDSVSDEEHDTEGRLVGFRFESLVAGSTVRGVASVTDAVEGESMTLEIENTEISASIHVALSSVDEGTSLRVSLEARGIGLVSSLLFPAVVAGINTGFPGAVEAFAASTSRS